MLVQLSLKSLNDLDNGRVSLAFMQELKRCVDDCMDRPGDKSARTITLELKLEPVIGEGGECEGADGEFSIKSKVPQRRSKTYSFRTNKSGHLAYSSESPENVNQTTIHDIDPDTGRVNRQPARVD